MKPLAADTIVALNLQAILRFGGTHGLLQEGCPERCTANAAMAEFYDRQTNELGLIYIGALMYYLIENHCFVDGNKRTALAVGLHLLHDLGMTLNATSDDLVNMCEAVAAGTIPIAGHLLDG